MIIREVLIIIAVSLFLIVFDKNASYYGNGILSPYYELNFETSITKINDLYLTNNSSEYGMGYIVPNEYYTDSLFVDKLLGYENTETLLNVYILSKDEIKQLTFYNNQMVNDKTPIIKNIEKLPNNIVNLASQPFLYYFWKLFFIIGITLNIALCGLILVRIILRLKNGQ